MKRNILLSLLIIVVICLITACSSNSNDSSKFEGTWIAYDKNGAKTQASGDAVLEMTIESLKNQTIVSIYSYSYTPLLDDLSSGLFEAPLNKRTGETALVHADYLLQKHPSSIHNELAPTQNNQIILSNAKSSKSDSKTIIYNEKDDTLIMGNIVFTKQSKNNTVQSHLLAMQDTLKAYCKKFADNYIEHKIQKPTIQMDFSFDDSILNSSK